jgi:hypothetical protein
MSASSTASGMKNYKPRREPGSLDDVVYPETRAKMQEAKSAAADAKETAKNEADYNKSLTTENKAKGGMTAKFMSFSKTGKPAGMKNVTKMASGGMTASSRADGCCTKGKTRGKMV